MKTKEGNNDILVMESTGREFYANGGIIGLGPYAELSLAEGYDGGFGPGKQSNRHSEFAHSEVKEIYDEMVTRWVEWRYHNLSLLSADIKTK